MNELTVTLTGQKAEEYTNMKASLAELHRDNTKITKAYEDAVLKYDKLVDEHVALKAEIADLTAQLNKAQTNSHYTKKLLNTEVVKPTHEELNEKYNQTIVYTGESPSYKDIDNSEKDTTVSEVIESNPVSFPATANNKPKSGAYWTKDELDVIKRSLEANYTLAFLKVKLSNRSEAAIRSMLLSYGIGVKNNKLYAR